MCHIKNLLQEIGKVLVYYSSIYGNFRVLGDFNGEMSNSHMSEFFVLYNFTNLIKEPTSHKNVDKKPTPIDHILINHARCFQHSGIYETHLSGFHKQKFTVLKIIYAKQKPRIIKYRDFKNVDIFFRMDLLKELSLSELQKGDFNKFKFLVITYLNLMLLGKKNILGITKHLL